MLISATELLNWQCQVTAFGGGGVLLFGPMRTPNQNAETFPTSTPAKWKDIDDIGGVLRRLIMIFAPIEGYQSDSLCSYPDKLQDDQSVVLPQHHRLGPRLM